MKGPGSPVLPVLGQRGRAPLRSADSGQVGPFPTFRFCFSSALSVWAEVSDQQDPHHAWERHPIPLLLTNNGTPLQYSCLENSMDGGAWWAAVHGVTKGQTRLSDFTFTFHFHALEKEMATHSSVLAWRIPGTVEPGGLPSMGSHRVGHN